MQPVFQSVLHQRIHLAQRYSKGQRHIPPNSIRPLQGHPRLRQRCHDFAFGVEQPTGIRYCDSALEVTSQMWNRIPTDIMGRNENQLRKRVLDAAYRDAVWELQGDMQSSILRL